MTKKISRSLARIAQGRQDRLVLGNIDAARDWGYAPDYVRAMHMMLQGDTPTDYVVATGEVNTVRGFVERACTLLGIELEWQGVGVEEVGIDSSTGKVRVEVSPHYFRPTEVEWLCGDASRIRQELGWKPEVDFTALVEVMVRSDMSGEEVRPQDLHETGPRIS